ncbi:MAG: CapA family protein [Thermomicrobiales bacterium]
MTGSRGRNRSPLLGRRAFVGGLIGVGAAGIATSAYGISRLMDENTATPAPGSDRLAASPATTRGPAASPAASPATRSAARLGPRAQTSTALSLASDQALVASPRLPLFGVGEEDVARLLSGDVRDWYDAGSPVDMPVTSLALDGQVPEGAAPAETVADYEALVEALAATPGGVAVVLLAEVDFRVNVLAVGGFDPLREAEDAIRIGVVGDIVPGRNVDNKMRAYGDFTHPFHRVAAELSSYDLAFANLEGNLSANIAPPADAHTFSFISDPAMIEGMKLAGIDGLTLANNHSTWNSAGWGVQALLDTLEALDAAGMTRFGAGRNLAEARAPWVAEVNGTRIAVLGIDGVTANEEPRASGATVNESWLGAAQYAGATDDTPGTNPFISDQHLADIGAAAEEYDVVIPYFHMGVEYVAVPPDWAVQATHAALDAGATMVVTNHPHVIQGMGTHEGKPIVYSPGNFIFDQMFSVEVRTGLILEIVLRGNRVVGLRPKGVEIVDFHQPRLMAAGEHAALMDRFWWATDRLASGAG